mmetsp:Transcript_64491/g.118771  ORF Transcript_64491/g.118771 Transcript_64491/m.118771 type:complete len:83 (-) Transcript_64491:1-249(-)
MEKHTSRGATVCHCPTSSPALVAASNLLREQRRHTLPLHTHPSWATYNCLAVELGIGWSSQGVAKWVHLRQPCDCTQLITDL